MLIKNQNHLNKVDLESNSTEKFEIVTRKLNIKQGNHKTDEIKCSSRYETLFTDDNNDESCNSHNSSTSSDGSTSSDAKEKKSKNLNENEGNEKEGQK